MIKITPFTIASLTDLISGETEIIGQLNQSCTVTIDIKSLEFKPELFFVNTSNLTWETMPVSNSPTSLQLIFYLNKFGYLGLFNNVYGDKKNILLYPSPVTGDLLNVYFCSKGEFVNITILSLYGKKVFETSVVSKKDTYNTFRWNLINNNGLRIANGTYILFLQQSDGTIVSKGFGVAR